MLRLQGPEIQAVLEEKLELNGVEASLARQCAEMLVENSLDGIYSHGVNRFPRLVRYLQKGYIRPAEKPECTAALGALEQWDGHLGMGNTNAALCMERAVHLARQHGIGCVALRNTNHWMRGGSYGIQAAKAGCAALCWTNTQPNMPAWGAKDRRIGNNPLVFAAPYKGGHVMVDGAMAQFSYGAIEAARLAGRQLPVPGGYGPNGQETCDPAAIEQTWRVLPIGYWKGSGFSVLLDILAASLSKGNTVAGVGRLGDDEYGLSQVFIALDLAAANAESDTVVEDVLADIKASLPAEEGAEILYPSEKEQRTRVENLRSGIPVEETVWQEILNI